MNNRFGWILGCFATWLLVSCFCIGIVNAQSGKPSNQENAPSDSSQTSLAADSPVVIGIVVDNTGSVREHLESLIQTTQKIAQAKQPKDEVFLFRFVSSDKIKLIAPTTVERAELSEAADGMYPEGGHSAVVDALYTSAEHFNQPGNCSKTNCKKSLILISDGEDRASSKKTDELLRYAKNQNIKIYSIWQFADVKGKQKDFLKKITEQTGGKAYFPTSDQELDSSITELLQNVRR